MMLYNVSTFLGLEGSLYALLLIKFLTYAFSHCKPSWVLDPFGSQRGFQASLVKISYIHICYLTLALILPDLFPA